MEIHLISLFPEMFTALNHGLIGKAINEKKVNIHHHHLRDFSIRKDRRIDDRPFGGQEGMVIQAEPIYQAKQTVRQQQPNTRFIILDPKGTPFKQHHAKELAALPSIALICGRYEGIDQRAYEESDWVFSVGDFVMTGGEIPALALLDSTIRLLPDVIGNTASHQNDSFQNQLLEHPCYTRPAVWRNQPAPSVLLSGNHQDIEKWQRYQQLGLTWRNRPDLMQGLELSDDDQHLLKQYIEEQKNVRTDSKD